LRESDRNTSLDNRIDAALRTYAEPQEIPDARIVALKVLERAREREPHTKWSFWRWAIPAAACLIALAIAAVWLLRMPRVPEIARTPAPPRIVAQTRIPAAPAPHPSVPAAPRKSSRVIAANSQPLPKLDVFPTPTPLSPQERALVAFAQHGPPAVQRAVLEDQKHWDDPIIVAGMRKSPPEAVNQQDR
jgi:hypothetical protein